MSDHRPPAPRPSVPRVRLWALSALVPVALAGCGADEASAEPATTDAAVEAPATEAPDRLDVVSTEYEWSGVPDRLPPGTYPLTLRNEGTDVHEIQVFQNSEGLTLEELFDLGPAEMADHVESAGGVIVGPDTTSEETSLELSEGTYEVVCFVPAATDQRPHFAHGMHRTLVVG